MPEASIAGMSNELGCRSGFDGQRLTQNCCNFFLAHKSGLCFLTLNPNPKPQAPSPRPQTPNPPRSTTKQLANGRPRRKLLGRSSATSGA